MNENEKSKFINESYEGTKNILFKYKNYFIEFNKIIKIFVA